MPSAPDRPAPSIYTLQDAGRGERLEQWGPFRLRRPDPRATMGRALREEAWSQIDAHYRGEAGHGRWERRGELPERWTIDLPLGVGRKNRVRIAAPRERLQHDEAAARWTVDPAEVIAGKPNYPSVTEVHRLLTGDGRSLLLALPRTGRRHQIRVHLAWTGTPIVGDPLFGGAGGRTRLHSWRLLLPGTAVDLVAPPDAGFAAALGSPPDAVSAALVGADRLWGELRSAGSSS